MPMIRTAILLLLTAFVVFGQTRKEFEVASIRPATEQAQAQIGAGVKIDGSQVRISYLSLKDYISAAYRVRLNQIIGPDWLGSQRFDIAAKLPEGGKSSEVNVMLQSLLVERFKMKIHREMREFPVYSLEVLKTGLKLTPAADADALEKNPDAVNVAAGGSAAGVMINYGEGSSLTLGATTLEIQKLSMLTIADLLTRFLDRPVVDMTNVKGAFDMKLDLTPEDRTVMLIRSAVAAGVILPPQALALLDAPSSDSLNTALKKIGLSLEPKRSLLEVIVVDQMEKMPTEN